MINPPEFKVPPTTVNQDGLIGNTKSKSSRSTYTVYLNLTYFTGIFLLFYYKKNITFWKKSQNAKCHVNEVAKSNWYGTLVSRKCMFLYCELMWLVLDVSGLKSWTSSSYSKAWIILIKQIHPVKIVRLIVSLLYHTLSVDDVSADSSAEFPDRASMMEVRLQAQEDEITLLKSSLADALRRIRLHDQLLPLLKQQLIAGESTCYMQYNTLMFRALQVSCKRQNVCMN